MPAETIFQEVERTTEDHKKAIEWLEAVSSVWTGIFRRDVTAEQVARCIIGMELCGAQANSITREGLLSIAGCAKMLEHMDNEGWVEQQGLAELGRICRENLDIAHRQMCDIPPPPPNAVPWDTIQTSILKRLPNEIDGR